MALPLPLSTEVGHWAHRFCASGGWSRVSCWWSSATVYVSVVCGGSNHEGEQSSLDQSRDQHLPQDGVGTGEGGVSGGLGHGPAGYGTTVGSGMEEPACSGASPCCPSQGSITVLFVCRSRPLSGWNPSHHASISAVLIFSISNTPD